MPAMAGQEDGLDPLKFSQSQLIGWRPERCWYRTFFHMT